MNIKYRPEIDGLRAIAVGSVILYHAQIYFLDKQVFPGGFIGVDIFFVISGYLITSIIFKELLYTDNFSYMKFYERRIRRILPALLFVISSILPLAWLFLLPYDFVAFVESIIYSLSFSSNIFFYYSGEIYEATSSLLIPFLHTWSLSVEEQFYILFPVIYLFIFKYYKKYIFYFLATIFLCSLFYATWLSINNQAQSFYFIQTRIWELLAGSILAYFEVNLGHRNKNNLYGKFFPSFGLLLIIFSVFFFNDQTFHPSFYTLLPIIGVCLFIWFANQDEFATKILSSKLFVGVGLLSYSLYLWHYPILAFSRITEFTQGNLVKYIFIFLSIFLASIFSYFFIEKKARNKNNSFKSVLYFLIPLILFNLIFCSAVIFKNGFKNRLSDKLQSTLIGTEGPWNKLTDDNGMKCHNSSIHCSFNKKNNRKIFLVGDSQMSSIMYDLKNRAVKRNYNFITSTFAHCFYFPGYSLVDNKTNDTDDKCNNLYFKRLENELINQKNSIVIFGGRLPLYLSNNYFNNLEGGAENRGIDFDKKYKNEDSDVSLQSSFNTSIQKILNKGNKVILVYPIPEVGWNVARKIFYTNADKLSDLSTSYDVYKHRSKSSISFLDSLKGENIYRVYPEKLFCNSFLIKRCIVQNEKHIFYYDNNHPSPEGARLINNLIINVIDKIEEEKQ